MFPSPYNTAQTTFHSPARNTDSVLWTAEPTVKHCAQIWRASTCLNGGIFGLPSCIRKVVCDVSEEPTISIFSLIMFEVDGEETGRQELAVYTGRTIVILAFQNCDCPKFPQTLL